MTTLTTSKPHYLIRCAILAVSAIVVFAGCQQGEIQTALYTDSHGQYPAREYEDDLWLLFKPEEGQRFVYVKWQDIDLFRISLLDHQAISGSPDQFNILIEPLINPQTMVRQQVAQNVRAHGAFEVNVAESQWQNFTIESLGQVSILLDATNYGDARLDHLRINFEPDFLQRVRRAVAGPPESVPEGWRFPVHTVLAETTQQNIINMTDYQTETDLRLDIANDVQPSMEFAVSARPTYQVTRNITIRESWEYWPRNPRDASPAAPARTRPLSSSTQPTTTQQEVTDTPFTGDLQPAANVTIECQVFAPELAQQPQALVNAQRNIFTNSNGYAQLDLRPFLFVCDISQITYIEIRYRVADDPRGQWLRRRIEINQLFPWYEQSMI
ncbi:MAG: hypothetical protein JW936_02975 [Sedimentisphaerales bacterium]|nr:hypothetical protein [Sedimentisphaerales bacterium]